MLHLQRSEVAMDKVQKQLRGNALFAGIELGDMESLLNCLSAARRSYGKNDYIFMEGDAADRVGILLSGSLHIIQEDFWGNRSILEYMEAGEVFGEAFSCAQAETLPISAVATANAEVLFIRYKKLVTTCPTTCGFHAQLIQNMLCILANKNIQLTRRITQVSQRNTREKLISYLSTQALQAGKNSFTIPLNRQELADYLGVDRSAMSTELGRMREDGLLRFERSSFTLLQESESTDR